jgi:hypothetical protein
MGRRSDDTALCDGDSDGAIEAPSVVSSQTDVPSVRARHCATGRQVAGSNLDGVIGIFH